MVSAGDSPIAGPHHALNRLFSSKYARLGFLLKFFYMPEMVNRIVRFEC